MSTIWIILAVVAVILLVVYWNKKTAVWGGLTLGLVIGFVMALFPGFDWYVVAKGGIVGTLIGFGAELLGMISNGMGRRK